MYGIEFVEVFYYIPLVVRSVRMLAQEISLHSEDKGILNCFIGDEGFFGTDEDEDGTDPESAPVFDSSVDKERKVDGELLVSAHDEKPGRDYKKTNWTLEECMVLQAAKQDDFERQAKEKNRKAADRWQAVEDFCFRQNVCRSGQQCKDRWEKMSVDFKKIHNYQRHVTDDTANYWTLTGEEKKSKRLPLTFWQDVFVAMSKWFTKDRNGGSETIAHDSEAQHQEGKFALFLMWIV